MTRARAQCIALGVAGLMFIAYPALRPYSDETTLSGARAIGSGAWIAAHAFAMVGFILLAWSFPVLRTLTDQGGAARLIRWAPDFAWFGAALVLPYYGAEAFGLHAIAGQVVSSGDVVLLRLTDTVRYQPLAITMFGIGLLLLAVAGVAAAVTLWRASAGLRWGGAALGLGLLLFLPQFFLPAPLRVTHGLVLGLGCLLVAWTGFRRQGQDDLRPPRTSAAPRPAG